jgi:hypothetical protein
MNINHVYACHMLMAYLIYLFMLIVGWYIFILASK